MVPVSIIIPVYDVEQYLPHCLDSALSQSLDGIEIICVDDGSTDGSLEILMSYERLSTRIRVLQHESNRGLAQTRNTGVEHACGRYLFFLDADDMLASGSSIEHLYRIATATDANETIGGLVVWDESSNERKTGYHKAYLKTDLRGVRHRDHLCLIDNVVCCNKLIERQFWLSNGIRFDPELKKFEDNPVSCMIHVLASSISLTTQTTYVQRIRKSTTNRSLTQDYRNDHIWHARAGKFILDFLTDKDINGEILSRHQYRLFVWLAMDFERSGAQTGPSYIEDGIFHAYRPILANLPRETVRKIGEDLMDLVEALQSGTNDLARRIIQDRLITYQDPLPRV